MEPRLLSRGQLADILEVCERTVTRWDASGKIPKPVRLGRLLRWRQDEIERWVLARCPARIAWEKLDANDSANKRKPPRRP